MRAVGATYAEGSTGINLYDRDVRVEELGALIGAVTDGDGKLDIVSAAPLETAGANQISFVGGAKAAKQAAESQAGCLVVALDFENVSGRTILRVKEPRVQFAKILNVLHPRAAPPVGAHPTAVVAKSAVLDDGVSVGPNSVVGERVTIGAGTVVHANVTIYDEVEIGERCILHSGTVLGADGFGFVFERGRFEKFPQVGKVVIGNDVEIGANCCVDRAALGVTLIGDGTKLDNMVHIAHNCRIGKHVVIAAQTGMAGGCTIEDYAVIGGQVGLGEGVRIESGVTLGSGSGVLSHKIVRRGQVMWGTPARPLKEYLANLGNLSRIEDVRRRLRELEDKLK